MPSRFEEDGSACPLSEVGVEGAAGDRRDGDPADLAALSGDAEGAVAAVVDQVVDVGVEGLGDPQPVEGEQVDQGRGPGGVRGCGVEDAAEPVTGQPDRGGLLRHLGPADVGDGGVGEHADLEAVAVELRQAGQPPGHRRGGERLPGPRRRVAGQLPDPGGDVVPAGLKRVHAGDGEGPAGPGLQVGLVGAGAVRGVLGEEGHSQPLERVQVGTRQQLERAGDDRRRVKGHFRRDDVRRAGQLGVGKVHSDQPDIQG